MIPADHPYHPYDWADLDPASRAIVALWSHVLLTAIREASGTVYCSHSKTGSLSLQREALDWIFNPPEPRPWNSFDGLCQIFDWDPDHIRARLQRQPDIARALKKFQGGGKDIGMNRPGRTGMARRR